MKTEECSLAILAGGKNSRFGGASKALAVINGMTILDRMLKQASGLFTEILLIANDPQDFRGIPEINLLPDIFPGQGPLAGIHSALVHSSGKAVFAVSCDMPFVESHFIRSFIREFDENLFDIRIPVMSGRFEPLHAIYSRKILGIIENSLENIKNPAIRVIFDFVRLEKVQLENTPPNKRMFMNINTKEDLLNL